MENVEICHPFSQVFARASFTSLVLRLTSVFQVVCDRRLGESPRQLQHLQSHPKCCHWEILVITEVLEKNILFSRLCSTREICRAPSTRLQMSRWCSQLKLQLGDIPNGKTSANLFTKVRTRRFHGSKNLAEEKLLHLWRWCMNSR